MKEPRKYQIYSDRAGRKEVSWRRYVIHHIKKYKEAKKLYLDAKLGFINIENKGYLKWMTSPTTYKNRMRSHTILAKWALEERRWHRASKLMKKILKDLEKL